MLISSPGHWQCWCISAYSAFIHCWNASMSRAEWSQRSTGPTCISVVQSNKKLSVPLHKTVAKVNLYASNQGTSRVKSNARWNWQSKQSNPITIPYKNPKFAANLLQICSKLAANWSVCSKCLPRVCRSVRLAANFLRTGSQGGAVCGKCTATRKSLQKVCGNWREFAVSVQQI